MITIHSFQQARNLSQYDSVWAIVRSLKSKSSQIEQHTELSPSKDLFFLYLQLKKEGHWNKTTFQSMYVPQFLYELKYGAENGKSALNNLWKRDKIGENICLLCFCPNETLCHRSIVAGLLQATGCNVVTETGTDFSQYYQSYRKI